MGYSNKLRKPDGSYKLVNSGDYVIQNITDTTVKFKTDKGDIEFKAFKYLNIEIWFKWRLTLIMN